MPRGVQKTVEEKLQIIDRQIAETEAKKTKIQNTLNELNNRRKEVMQTIQNKKLQELSKMLDSVGKSPEDIITMLKN
ncbi:MAG TPA: hypothetical protein DEB10_04910 [Ruminococcaceae bacterium]|jgi:flagellar basal body P-ring protein FlgI|nr:hypothetical protein [Oscillospiraceae bacterium]